MPEESHYHIYFQQHPDSDWFHEATEEKYPLSVSYAHWLLWHRRRNHPAGTAAIIKAPGWFDSQPITYTELPDNTTTHIVSPDTDVIPERWRKERTL